MTDLLQIPPHLRARIASKLEWKAYFRMQQTCKEMEAFFQNSQNVKISSPPLPPWLIIHTDSQESPHFYLSQFKKQIPVDLRSLYGVRFYKIEFGPGVFRNPNNQINYSAILKKYRITCKTLDTLYLKGCFLTKDTYEALLKAVNPVDVILNSSGSNRFEALLTVKNLTRLYLSTSDGDIQDLHIIKDLLTKLYLYKLEIDMEHNDMTSLFNIVKTILQYLNEPLPNLHSFSFRGSCEELERLPPKEELTELLRDFDPTLDGTDWDAVWKHSFGIRNRNQRCRVVFRIGYVDIFFGNNNYE